MKKEKLHYCKGTLTGFKPKDLIVIDPKTQEVYDCFKAVTQIDFGDEQFEKTQIKKLFTLLDSIENLNSTTIHILNYLVQCVNFQTNEIQIRQKILAKKLNLTERTIRTEMKKLKSANIITHNINKWFLNPKLIFKGNKSKKSQLEKYYNGEIEIGEHLIDIYDTKLKPKFLRESKAQLMEMLENEKERLKKAQENIKQLEEFLKTK